ncbi:MAG: AbrB/MazE/SpoVT family DNA-binding domain-containing protein [Alkalinema sp. CAN_BIN05]|nr:AbrB/MazE/SpoVT family DNA-binding domain-containing protein [Alkalinema sp. CAN_BIN05]
MWERAIIKIGNSQGIRIPKLLLEQCGLRSEVEIGLEGDHLTIQMVSHPRAGWAEAFARMAENGDVLFDEYASTEWDENEWEW